MSVIKRFDKALLEIGIPTLENNSVFYSAPVAIRFEIVGWCVKRGITENQSFYDESLETLISIINGEESHE